MTLGASCVIKVERPGFFCAYALPTSALPT